MCTVRVDNRSRVSIYVIVYYISRRTKEENSQNLFVTRDGYIYIVSMIDRELTRCNNSCNNNINNVTSWWKIKRVWLFNLNKQMIINQVALSFDIELRVINQDKGS